MRATLLLCTALAGCTSFSNGISEGQASLLAELRRCATQPVEDPEAGTPTPEVSSTPASRPTDLEQTREWLSATATHGGGDVDIASVAVKNGNGDSWRFLIAPYAWLPTVAGNAGVQGNFGPVALTMDDVLDHAVFAFTGRAEARKGDWALMLDGAYFNLEGDDQAGPVTIDADLEYSLVDVAVGYRFLEVPVHDSQLELEVKLGTRWQYIKLDLDLTPGPAVSSKSNDFQELLVGGRAILKFNERASFAAAVDFSGFGIGSGSRLTWNLELIMRYMMTESTLLGVGYRLLDVDFSSGHGSSRQMLDAQFSGPVLGVGFVF